MWNRSETIYDIIKTIYNLKCCHLWKKSFDRKARFMDIKKYNSFSKSFIQILESDDALNGTGWGFLK